MTYRSEENAWMYLRGSDLTPFVEVFFTQQRTEIRQLNSKDKQHSI